MCGLNGVAFTVENCGGIGGRVSNVREAGGCIVVENVVMNVSRGDSLAN